MGEGGQKRSKTEEVIEAFDRERAEAHEHYRRHKEWVRRWRDKDRPAYVERQRQKQ
jgi:hypothetical protein